MAIRMAINGFGRIGRMVFRRAMDLGMDVVAINGTAPSGTLAHLVKHDSIQGPWKTPIEETNDGWVVNGKQIQLFATRDPGELPWGELDVDVIVESTGQFRTFETAARHLHQGARKVIITAPGKGEPGPDVMLVIGVNDHMYHPDRHHVISGASCTTNCLAPVAKVLDDKFGIEYGMVTTVHAYTNDQRTLDNPHKDLRRARACGQSIIPTSTGAARAIGEIIPNLRGKLNGISLRVPTPNVSLVDLVAHLETQVTAEDINHALQEASQSYLHGILGYTEEPLVSIDFTGDEHSAIVDGSCTMVLEENTVKVLAWYDNEWGYACRMVDIVRLIEQSAKQNVVLSRVQTNERCVPS